LAGNGRYLAVAGSEHSVGAHRTELAEDRTILANERTFAGWMRTSLGCIGLGVGFHALFNKVEPGWLPRGIASLFLVLGAIVILLAARRASSVISRLDPHVVQTTKRMNLRLFAAAIVLGAGGLIVGIWTLPRV
jgi:putative membrane protein